MTYASTTVITPQQAWKAMRKGFELRSARIAADVITRFEEDVEKIESGSTLALRLRRLVEIEVDHTDRVAEKYYEACCEIWELLGRRKCRAFFQAVLDHCLLPLLRQRGRVVERQVNSGPFSSAPSSDINAAIVRYRERLAVLRMKWRNRLEIDAHNSELKQQGDGDSGRTIRKRPGPARTRSREFVELVRSLWVSGKGKNRQSSEERLLRIAGELDRAGYVPPSKYLERAAARELKKFNSTHARTTPGPIRTWAQLATGDKDQRRAMGKLLSRYANDPRD
jgi:hypothetical protein